MDDKTVNRRSGLGVVYSARLSPENFGRLSQLVSEVCGIKMPAQKKVMLEARLRKRLRALNIGSFDEYCKYLFSPEGQERELVPMIDVVTTNKTDFFREARHFDFLTKVALPELRRQDGAGFGRPLLVWSAGCSTGEEPYTIAMVLNEYKAEHPAFHFDLLATDISTHVLDKAFKGIYRQERIDGVQPALRQKYFMRSRDRDRKLVRVAPELRAQVRFRRLNFMDADYDLRRPLDIIFCRNVIIYFDRPTQQRLISRFCKHLRPGGYLFMGHSETLSGLHVPLVNAGPMIYRRVQ